MTMDVGESAKTRRAWWWHALAATAVFVASLGLAACGGGGIGTGGQATTVSVAKAQGKPSGELTISNWPLYIDKKTVPEFEQRTGIDVKYIEDINSYDEFFGKMQPLLARGESGGRSLMVATDWLAKKMYDLGYIQKLDKSALQPAVSHLSPTAKPPSTDPHWTFSIPWQGGMTGLIVNTQLAPDVKSVNDILDPQYKGKVDVVTELREVVPLFMKAEGIDPDTATTQDWLDTIDKLKQAADSGQIRRFTGNDYAKDLVAGDAVAVVGWAADAIQLQADNPNLKWVMPTQGCMIWWDDWVIPVGAPNPTAGYAFINYTYQPKHQAQIDAWTSSVTPVAGVKQIFEKTDPQAAKNPLIFPSSHYARNCSTPISPPGNAEDQKKVEQAWASLTSG
jgi:spermidine/putrescine transport system substrate-binding protein